MRVTRRMAERIPLKKRGLGGCKITPEQTQPPESPFIKGDCVEIPCKGLIHYL